MNSANPTVILSACKDPAKARSIARTLVEQRLAACVSVRDNYDSFFRWQGKVRRDNESLMIIKTLDNKIEQIEAILKNLSDYEVPEVIALGVIDGAPDYIEWLNEQVEE